jgi:peptide/nickel transport system substrate-binding protein/oligopeptide transport system substrate-binding protein
MRFSKSAPNVAPTVAGTPMAPYDQQIYRYPLPVTDIATLDPALSTDIYSDQAIMMVFNGLVQVDDSMQIQPDLAQSWEESADGLRWTFHLRPHLTFSDATPLTSKDVAYSIDRQFQPPAKSLTCSGTQTIKDAEKVCAGQLKTIIGDGVLFPDANTVVYLLAQKTPDFLYNVAGPFVVEKSLIDKYGNDKFTGHLGEGGGSGPFIVSQYIPKQEIDFAPNPYYYGFKPLLQKVIFRFIPTQDATYRDYQNGQLDYTSVPFDRVDEARQLTDQYAQTPLLWIGHFAMNFLVKPFDNLHMRQAFALSINRETINNTVFDGTRIPTYHIIPQGMQGYNLNLTGPANVKDSRGNIPLARQLFEEGLREEGWSNVSQMPAIKLTYTRDPMIDKIITVATQMWGSALGVNVIPNPVDFDTLNTEVNDAPGNAKGIQMWFMAHTATTLSGWITGYFGKGSAWNAMNYGQNTTADALQEQQVQQQMERADVEENPTTRLLLYQSAEQQIINQVGWIPIYQKTAISLLKPYVKGVVPNPLGETPPSDWAQIYIAVH